MKKKKKPNPKDEFFVNHSDWLWKTPNHYQMPKVHPLPMGSKVHWTEETCKALASLPEMAQVMAQARTQAIEKVIVKIVEGIEGGRPTNHDAEVFGRRNIYPDGLEIWTWRGLPIITVENLENFVIKITELEYAQ